MSRTRFVAILGSLAVSVVTLTALLVLLGALGGSGLPVAQAAPHISAAQGDVTINEVRIDQPDSDNDEYFELAGTANASLDGLTYLVIGDGAGGSGVIEAVVALTGTTIPADGFFLVAEDDDTFGAVADLTATLNFENSDNVTHLLVDGFTGSNGDDLDTDDDGVLDSTPWTQIVDLVALIEEENPPAGTEYHYGPPTVGPDGSYVPGHVYKCYATWLIGEFNPVGGDDTPGIANNCPAQYDAGIAKTGLIALMPGTDVTYTISYSNAGVEGLTSVVITDELPAGATYVTDTSGLTCAACTAGATGPLAWTLGTTLTFGSGVSFDLVVHITDTASGDLVNTVSITADRDDDLTNNEDTHIGRATAYDLEVTKSVDTEPIFIENGFSGQLVTYTIKVQNYSLVTDTTALTITDVLPDSFVYVSDDSGMAPPSGTGTAGLPLVWTFTDIITHGTSIEFHVVVSATDSILTSGLYQNQVGIVGDPADSEIGNNTAQDTGVFVWRLISIADARALPDGASVYASGYVNFPPGLLHGATQTYDQFMLQDAALGTSGLAVYYTGSTDKFADFAAGDEVRVRGTMDEYNGKREIIVVTPAHAITTGNSVSLIPWERQTGQIGESTEGILVQVSGTVLTATSSYLNIDDGSGVTTIYRDWDTGVSLADFEEDDAVWVLGVSTQYDPSEPYDSGYQVIPRFQSDITEYPRVLSVGPADGATGVAVGANVTATFNLTMTNVDTTTFLLEGPGGAVDGVVTYDDATQTATFDPIADLDYSTTYTATLVAELAATNGLTRGKDIDWSFTAGMPDLAIAKTVEPETDVPLGSVVTYTIMLVNNGDGVATGVVMTDELPSEVEFGGWIVNEGTAELPDPPGDTIEWGPRPVVGGDSYTIRFTATVTTSTTCYGAVVTNTVEFDSVNAGSDFDDAVFTTEGLQRIYLPLVTRNY